ncbi:MAG: hypothetical protein MUE40_03625 [Anaerolineae bacterium]|jgi:hypothetical protein|nr:hypothetical protein [Anaerolineae bacterium]
MQLSLRTVIVGLVAVSALIIAATAIFVPGSTHPAYEAATAFVNAAGRGDEAAALAQASPALRAAIAADCPGGRVSDCVAAYADPDWGRFLNGVYRRAQPDGLDAWDVQIIATYQFGVGFSGICIYNRVERQPDDSWQVVAWSGWVSCSRPDTGLSALMQPAAVHRFP